MEQHIGDSGLTCADPATVGALTLAGVALSFRKTVFVIASKSDSETNGVVQVTLPLSVCNRGDTCVTVAVSFEYLFLGCTTL